MKKVYLLILFLIIVSNAKAAIIEQEVEFYNGSIKLGGTLTLPDTIGKYPALVMVTGSGQQNRDEEIFGFKIFKIIAEYLTNNGLAVLRFDDRGVGKSKNKRKTVDTATTYDFAQDAYAGVKLLKSHKNINVKQIGVFGHSEGGIIAAMLAADYPKDIAFIISMAGPSIPGSKIINYQIASANKESGISDSGIQVALKYQNLIYQALEANKSVEELTDILYKSNYAMIEFMPKEQTASITNKEEYAKAMATISVKQVVSPWFKYFVLFDPAPKICKIECPTLALFGEKDTQVPPELNVEPYRSEFKGREQLLTLKIIPSANHLFQKANTGLGSEYSNLNKEFAPEFLETILKWLKDNNYTKAE